ncbi:MAG TPA: S1C family serine protease [Candidatus Paceibacterota bacterium]
MDIKDLNKPQLILLGLLVSFVTSLATGIVTVTLMQQAPPSLIAPVNRVIQQTVEKIQQVEGKTTVQTVVVKEEDLVVDAISKNQSAVFTVTRETFDLENKLIEVSAGRGFAVSTSGLIAVDGELVSDPTGIYYMKNDSGKFKATFEGEDKSGFALLKAGAPLDPKSKLAYTVPAFGDLSKMKAGQKIILLSNAISSFIYEGSKDLRLSVAKSSAGGLVLNIDGEALGIMLSGDLTSFAPINTIADAIKDEKPVAPATDPKTP